MTSRAGRAVAVTLTTTAVVSALSSPWVARPVPRPRQRQCKPRRRCRRPRPRCLSPCPRPRLVSPCRRPSVTSGSGRPGSIPGLTPPAVQSGLDLAHREMGVYAQATGRPILESAASLDGPDSLRFQVDGDSAGCRSGDVGTYTFTLSETGRALTLHAADDPCASRVAAISGDWVRANCPPPGWCLGDLDPGRHVSAGFNPWAPPQAWQYDYGRFSYVVPDGWQNFEDGGDGYALAKQDAPEGTDALPVPAIHIWQDVLANAQTPGCENAPAPGVGHTPRAIATWLSSLPSLTTTKPKSVTIGGLHGFTLDLSINPASKSTCPWMDGKPAATLFITRTRHPRSGGASRASTVRCGCSCSIWAAAGRSSSISRRRIRRPGRRSSQMRCRSSKASSSSTDIGRVSEIRAIYDRPLRNGGPKRTDVLTRRQESGARRWTAKPDPAWPTRRKACVTEPEQQLFVMVVEERAGRCPYPCRQATPTRRDLRAEPAATARSRSTPSPRPSGPPHALSRHGPPAQLHAVRQALAVASPMCSPMSRFRVAASRASSMRAGSARRAMARG